MRLNVKPSIEKTPTRSSALWKLSVSFILASATAFNAQSWAADAPKPATEATKAANDALLKELPFNDKTSFELAHKGLMAPKPRLRS